MNNLRPLQWTHWISQNESKMAKIRNSRPNSRWKLSLLDSFSKPWDSRTFSFKMRTILTMTRTTSTLIVLKMIKTKRSVRSLSPMKYVWFKNQPIAAIRSVQISPNTTPQISIRIQLDKFHPFLPSWTEETLQRSIRMFLDPSFYNKIRALQI